MPKTVKITDDTPVERRTEDHALRVRLMTKMQPRIDEIVMMLHSTGVGLSEVVLFVFTESVRSRLPFELPKMDDSQEPTIYIMPEPRASIRDLLQKTYAFASRSDTLEKFDEPPAPGYIYVVIGSASGFTTGSLGEYILQNVPAPDSANN